MHKTEVIRYDEADFHKVRRQGIGGSDIAAVVNQSIFPDNTALKVYCDKLGLGDNESNLPMRVGRQMEPLVAELFLEHNEEIKPEFFETSKDGRLLRCENGLAFYHPDGLLYDSNGKIDSLVEFKTSTAFSLWGYESKVEDVPIDYYLQIQWGMGITGAERAYLCVLLSNREYRQFIFERDDKIFADLLDSAEAFILNNVKTETPPACIASENDVRLLAALYPDKGEVCELTEEIESDLEEYFALRAKISEFEGILQGYSNKVREHMKTASEMSNERFRVTYKKTKDGLKTDWKKVAEQLKESTIEALASCGLDQKAEIEALFDTIVEAKSTVKLGSRRFYPRELKND